MTLPYATTGLPLLQDHHRQQETMVALLVLESILPVGLR